MLYDYLVELALGAIDLLFLDDLLIRQDLLLKSCKSILDTIDQVVIRQKLELVAVAKDQLVLRDLASERGSHIFCILHVVFSFLDALISSLVQKLVHQGMKLVA